jgi:hypothetical protein
MKFKKRFSEDSDIFQKELEVSHIRYGDVQKITVLLRLLTIII